MGKECIRGCSGQIEKCAKKYKTVPQQGHILETTNKGQDKNLTTQKSWHLEYENLTKNLLLYVVM